MQSPLLTDLWSWVTNDFSFPIFKSTLGESSCSQTTEMGNQQSLAERKQMPGPTSQRVDFLVGLTTGGGSGSTAPPALASFAIGCLQCNVVLWFLTGFWMFIKQAASCLSATWEG